jgi:hypothetical protein
MERSVPRRQLMFHLPGTPEPAGRTRAGIFGYLAVKQDQATLTTSGNISPSRYSEAAC